MPTASGGIGGAGMVVSDTDIERARVERDAAMAKKNSILKEYGKDIDKPAQLILDQKKIDAYFDGDVFNSSKAREFVEEYTAKYGGGSYLQEMMLAKIKTRLQEEKDKPLLESFLKKELKDRGVDQSKYGKEFYSRLTSKPIADADQLKEEAKLKSEQIANTAKSKAENAISKFTSYTESLNKQIESGMLTPEQAKTMYAAERTKTESIIKSINDSYTRSVRDINVNLRRRYSRIQDEVKAIEGSITPEMIEANIPAADRKKINEAYTAATNNLYKVKNEKKKIADQSVIGSSPMATVFGKSLASGFTRSLASFGDYMLKEGVSNSFTKWLSDLSTTSEKTSTAEYDWKEPHLKILKLTGESTGGSLPFMVPALALSAIPGAQPLAAAAVGGLVNARAESMTEGGQTFRESLEKGDDAVVAAQKADKVNQENMKNIPLYMIGSLGDFLLLGKGGTAKKIGGTLFELAEEVPLSVRQEYERAKLDGYTKGIGVFVKENPSILADTFIATIGMSSVMAGAGKAFSSITSKAPAPTSQHIQDMVSQSGGPTAKLVIEKMFENGVIDEAAKNKFMADIDRISITTDKLADVGITGDKSKLLVALADKEKELKQQVEIEQDSAVKNVLQGQLKSVQEDIKGVTDGATPFISFTLPGGNNMTRVMTANEFNALPQEQKDDIVKAADKISVIGDDNLQFQLNENKKTLGNMPLPDGAYTNNIANIESGMAVDQAGQLTINKDGIASNAQADTEIIKIAAPEAETGVTLNLDGTKYTGGGLVVPAASMNTTQEELTPQMLADFIDQNKAKLGDGQTFKVGYYKFPNSNQVSIDLNIVVDPKFREAALKFGKMAGQESLFDLGSMQNIKTGADGSNPRQFTDEEFVQIAKDLREGKVPFEKSIADEINEEVFGRKPVTIDQALSTAVDTAAKSLEKAGVKFSIIDSTTDQSGAARGNQAIFKSDTGEIIIDKSKLQNDIEAGLVVWHEAAHPVMNILRNTDKPLYDAVVNGLQEAAGKNEGIAAALGWAQENYGGQDTQNDEAIVETIGRINAGLIDINSLDTGFRQKLIDFINSIAKALGIDQILDNTNIAQFKKTVSEVADALKTGRDVAEIVGEENVKEFMNNLSDPETVAAGSYEIQPRISDSTLYVYESKEVENLPRRNLEDLYNQFEGKAVVINSDPTRVGELTLPSGKKIFMYGGPGYLSIKDNVSSNIGFATTQLSKVKSWAKYIKDVFGDKPGVTFVATQAPTSILSNSYSLRYVMDAISMLPKTVLRSSDFKNEFFGKDLVLLKDAFGEKGYNEFVSKYKKADLSDKTVIDGMISEMAYKVGDDNKPASFKARGAFVSNLLGGIAPKASIKTVEGDTGYVSKKPQKFIAKQLMDRLGINAEKVIREIGEPSLVDLYMNEGKWGMAVSGFETDPNIDIDSVQDAGVKHPLFNAKFPGKNPFILDGAYEIDKIFKPVEMTGPSGEPYTKKAAQMLAGSMYVKGMPTEVDGTFEYTKSAPTGGAIQASKANRNLIPEDKQKKLTDDGKGNYVFFHRTAGKLTKIDPKKFGSNIATGRDERPGVGISMFYVDSNTGEPGVPSNFIYAVRVPKEKVYPINEDPLNLYDEAKAMFDKDFPGQAFDANKQVGYITKVANEKGFEMTVVDWNIKGKKAVRAQTAQAVKPELYKSEEFRDGSLREVYNPELEKLKPGIQASAGNRTAADFGESADPKTKITLNDLGVYPGMSSQELLDKLIQFGGTFDPLLKAIAKKDISSLQIADMNEITDDPYEAAGGFLSKFTKDVDDRFKGKLYINTKADEIGIGNNQYYTLTHELMHWVTLDSLDTPVDSPAYNKLKDIYNVLLKNADTTPGFNTFSTYGLTNFNEFMAELFISAKFRDYVKDVMGTNEDLRSINNESKDLITLLVDYLKGLYAKIFGETGPIDENSPLIDQATKLAKDMFFGERMQASLGNRKLEQDQDFKLAAYVMRKKAEGTSIAEIAMGIMSAIPGMTVQEVNDLVSDPEQYIRTKFKYLSPALLENLISRAGVKNIYKKSTTKPDAAFNSLEVDINNIDLSEPSRIDNIKEKIREVKTKYFDAAKGLPNWVLAIKDISKGIANLEVRKAIDISKDLKKAAEAIGFTDWDAFSAAMKSLSQPGVMQSMSTEMQPWYANIAAERKQLQNAPAIQPAEILALPEEIRPFVFQMRGAIDGLSKDLIAAGFVTPEQALTIEENIGAYTNRAYRLFNEKGYKPTIEDRKAAIKYLADQYIKQLATDKAGMVSAARVEAEAIAMAKRDVQTIITKNVNPYFKKGDSRDTGILQERKDIPAPIRKLMGEYTDPVTVFVMTVAKQAALKSASQYLTGLRTNGLGSIFFEKNDPNRPISHSVEIASEGSEAKNPLGGLFTTPEIAEAINSIQPTVNDLTNVWMKVVGAVRWGKTVGSVVTQMKNFLSNIGFSVMNGLIFSGENVNALSGASKYYKGEWTGAKLDELAQKAMSLGLVNQSVGMSELKQMLGSGDIHDIAVEMAVTGKSGKAKNWIGKTIDGLNKSYQLSDDFWKVYGYLNERELLSKAMFDTKYDSLSSDQQASVDIEASERVKNTWPTYDRVWEGAKYVSQRAPIFGNFVSFQAESIRVLGNTIKLAVNDMKSNNPEFQAMGYKRLAGMITYVTLRSAITYAAAHAAGLGVAGLIGMLDDDDEKLKEEGIKNALPGFMRTSDLMVIPQGEKGKFTVFDLSSLDPYGVVFKSLNAMTEGREGIVGDKMDPGVAAAMAEFMSGFLEPEMTFKTMMSIANNTNEKTGGKIFMEDDSRTQAFLESAKYAADQLKPSTIGFVERLMGDNKIAEVSAAFGARPYEVDLTRSFGRIIATNGKNFEDIIREYNRVKYDEKATKEDKKAAELEAEKAMSYYAEKMNKIYTQFIMLGADPKKLDQIIMDKRPVRVTGWSKNIKKAVRTGKIESDKFLK